MILGDYKRVDLATSRLIPYLQSQGVFYLDAVFISHEDYDHCGALASLKEHFKVKKVIYDFKKKKIGDLVFKNLALDKYYTNSKGERVQSPTYYNSAPPGATALCRDGTYSFSKSRRGTCSHHGGVAKWLK